MDECRFLGFVRASDAKRPLLACLNRNPSTSRVAPAPGGPASQWTTGSCKAVWQKEKHKTVIGKGKSLLMITRGAICPLKHLIFPYLMRKWWILFGMGTWRGLTSFCKLSLTHIYFQFNLYLFLYSLHFTYNVHICQLWFGG